MRSVWLTSPMECQGGILAAIYARVSACNISSLVGRENNIVSIKLDLEDRVCLNVVRGGT